MRVDGLQRVQRAARAVGAARALKARGGTVGEPGYAQEPGPDGRRASHRALPHGVAGHRVKRVTEGAEGGAGLRSYEEDRECGVGDHGA